MAKDSKNEQVVVPPPKSGGGSNTGLKVVLIVIAIVVVLGFLTFAAFAWFFKSTVDKVGDAVETSQNDDGSYSYQIGDDEDGYKAEVGTKSVPDDFPEAVLLLDGQVIVGSSKIKVGDGSSWTVSAEIDGSPANSYKKITNKYTNDASWNNVTESQYDDVYNTSYMHEGDESLSLSVMISRSDENSDKSAVVYTVVKEIKE